MLLGLDLGTTNVKALVTDLEGRPLARGSRPVQLFHVGAGGVEQELDEIWSATLEAIRDAASSVDSSRILAMGISSQGGAMQMLDECAKPLGRIIGWLDDRGHADDDAITAELGRDWFRVRLGHGSSGLAIGQLLRLRRERPDWLRPPHHVGFVGDVVVARLCGRAAHDATSAGLTLLYNLAQRTYDPELLARLEVQPTQLPDLISPRARAGGLLPEVARQTGLPAGIPVSCAVHDQYAAALGTGVVRVGEVMFGAGTAWVLLAVSKGLAAPVCDEAFVCNHVVEDLYGQLVSLRNGGSALSWVLQLLGKEHLRGADLDAFLESVPPGCEGIVFWPYLVPYGAPALGPAVKGRFSGLQLSHMPAHLARAVMEGLACELNRHLELLRRAGVPVVELTMCGRAAASRVTPQILADLTGVPVACAVETEGSVLGAVILARGLLEPGRPLRDLSAAMAPELKVILPGLNAPAYRLLWAQYLREIPQGAA
jgi:xylulokinase